LTILEIQLYIKCIGLMYLLHQKWMCGLVAKKILKLNGD
jgi:hypothetical protein